MHDAICFVHAHAYVANRHKHGSVMICLSVCLSVRRSVCRLPSPPISVCLSVCTHGWLDVCMHVCVCGGSVPHGFPLSFSGVFGWGRSQRLTKGLLV